MGDGKGHGVVLGDVVNAYLNEAKAPNDTERGRENDSFIGQKIGFLWGAASGGLLDSVTAYKAQFEQDKEARDFAFGLLKKGLGQIAGKIDPSGTADTLLGKALDFGQKIYEAGRQKGRGQQIDRFKAALPT